MSTLVALAYPDLQTAFEVRQTLGGLQKQYLLDLADAVVVTRDAEGKVKLDQSVPIVEAGAANGALWGGLIGLLFLNPLAGLAVGAATGGLLGKAADYGIDDNFMRELGSRLQPNSSALFILTRGELNDRVLPELGRFGGTVLQTSLTSEAETRLREALSESAYRAAGGAVDLGTTSSGGRDDTGATSGGTTSGGTTSGGTTTGGIDSGGLTPGGTTTGGTTTGGLAPGGPASGGTTTGENGPRGATPGGTTGGLPHSHQDSGSSRAGNNGAAPDGGPVPHGAPGSGDERIAPDGSDRDRPRSDHERQGVSEQAADKATEPPLPDAGRSAK